jgi:hypothetical protein
VSCERVAFSRIRGSCKAAQIPEEGNGSWGGGGWESKVSAGSTPDPSQGTKMLGKTPLPKKAHKKSLTSIEQSLMAGSNYQGGRGKYRAAAILGQAWLL